MTYSPKSESNRILCINQECYLYFESKLPDELFENKILMLTSDCFLMNAYFSSGLPQNTLPLFRNSTSFRS